MSTPIHINQLSIQSLLIRMYYNDTLLGTGTGFVVEKSDEYILITNRHNLTGKNTETGELLFEHGAFLIKSKYFIM